MSAKFQSLKCTIIKVTIYQKKESIQNCLKPVARDSRLTSRSNLCRFVKKKKKNDQYFDPILKHYSCSWGLEEFGSWCRNVKKTLFSVAGVNPLCMYF